MKLLAVLLSLFTATSAFAGWDSGNAGDPYAAEFIMTGKDLAARLKLAPASELKKLDLARLNETIGATTVRTDETLTFKDGHEVGAINYPDTLMIKLSRTVWRTFRPSTQTNARFTFVLHEYLGIMKIDDKNYKVSSPLIALIDAKEYSPARWWNPLNPVNKISLDMAYKPAGCSLESLSFDPSKTEETVKSETKGACGDSFRKLVAVKSSATAPPESGARGTFHRFAIDVLNRKGIVVGQIEYEPEWGKCLGPQEGSCRLSGKVISGDVEMIFWFKLD